MLSAAAGLTEVADSDLKKALTAVHRGWFAYPIRTENLARVGLQHCADELLGSLRGLDEAGVRAVLVAVLAERRPANRDRRLRAQLRGAG